MIFRQLFDNATSTYTYLIADEQTRLAMLIDAVKEHTENYLQLIKELGLTLSAAFDTHVHADHITASGELRQRTQCEIIMGKHSPAQGVTQYVDDQESFAIGNLVFTVLYTPGHTDDSYCCLLPNRVFTGDCLLIRGTGRTDFQHGDPIEAYCSIRQKLLTLPDDTFVYPAHDYKGWTVSTIGEEKQFNPRLQVANAQEYKKIMDNLNLPRPKRMDQAVPANLRCGIC